MKPIVIFSLIALVAVVLGGSFLLTMLDSLPPMTGYGLWPYWMLVGAIIIVVILAGLFFGLMFYSARHHDHKVFKPDEFDRWDD